MTQTLDASARKSTVQYVTTDDGYRIAYSVTGEGDPFLFTPCLVQNDILQHDPGTADFVRALESRFRLIRYDGRGTGNSTRGLPPNMTIEDTARDTLAVIRELGLNRLILYGDVFSCYPAFMVAAQLQETVRAIVLVIPQEFDGKPLMPEWEEMYSNAWEAFTNVFTATFGHPGRSGRDMREAVDHADFVRLANSARGYHLADLFPKVKTPTLVLCYRNTALPTTLPSARKITSAIPGSELAILEGRKISDILCNAPDGPPPAMAVIERFLVGLPDPAGDARGGRNGDNTAGLSARELEVLRLFAAGRSNQQIAGELVISLSTVAKHVTSILTKTESANRTEAAAYAHRQHLV
jgi:DNA-binding CsgD family transcriptional regulator/pimeloyl-ACP methyl ester carboxylesterase